jgi:TRAP transporter TAXI family solute receptor
MNRCAAFMLSAPLAITLTLTTELAAQPRRALTIAAGSVDGVYYPIAGAISRITADARGLNIRATVQASAGSVANVQLLRSSEADFALIQNDIAYYAFNGVEPGPFAGKPVKGMAGVFSVYPELVHILATQASGVKSVHDLRSKRVALGPRGSGTEQNALQILAAYGIVEADLGVAERVPFGAAADQLKAGAVDAAFFTVALGAPVVADTLAAGKVGLVAVGRTAGETLEQKYPFYTMEEVPPNAYKGQDREIVTPAVMAMLVARPGLTDDVVYRFTKAVFDNLPMFHGAHPAARNLTLQTALSGMPLPLHPGAQRFFKEKGIAR